MMEKMPLRPYLGMTRQVKVAVVALTAALLTGFLCWLRGSNVADPMHDGRRVSDWLYESYRYALHCDNCYEAIRPHLASMKVDAVPYLVNQLTYDRSGIRKKTILGLQWFGLIDSSTDRVLCYMSGVARQQQRLKQWEQKPRRPFQRYWRRGFGTISARSSLGLRPGWRRYCTTHGCFPGSGWSPEIGNQM